MINSHFRLLLSNVVFFGLGLAFVRAASLVGIPLLTHSIKNPSVFAYFDLVFAFASVLAGIANFGITESTYKIYFERHTDRGRSAVIATSIASSIFLAACVGCLFLLILSALGDAMPLLSPDPWKYGWLIFAMTLGLRLRYTLEMPHMLLNARTKIVGVNAIETILFFFVVWLFISFEETRYGIDILIVARLLALIIGSLLLFFLHDGSLGSESVNKKMLRSFVFYGGPLAAGSLLYSILSIGDRFSISYFLGATALGSYAVVAKFAAVGEFLRSSFNQGFWFFFFKSSKDTNHENRMSLLLETMMIFITILFIAASLSSEWIFGHLVAQDFQSAHVVLGELIVAPLILGGAQVVGASLIKDGKTWHYTLCQIVGVFFSVLLTCILTEMIGIQGAAFSTLVGYVAMLILILFLVKRLSLPALKIRMSFFWIAILSVSVLIDLLFSRSVFIYWLIAIIIFSVSAYRNEVKRIFIK